MSLSIAKPLKTVHFRPHGSATTIRKREQLLQEQKNGIFIALKKHVLAKYIINNIVVFDPTAPRRGYYKNFAIAVSNDGSYSLMVHAHQTEPCVCHRKGCRGSWAYNYIVDEYTSPTLAGVKAQMQEKYSWYQYINY